MGPIALFDKSFIQSLSVDEAVLFDHFFLSVLCPLFYVETLADLQKQVREGRTQEEEVRIIAQKTPEAHCYPCAEHHQICLSNLMGEVIPMTGQIPIIGGRAVKAGDRRAVMFNEAPEAEAFRRWRAEEFLEIERRSAKTWRKNLGLIDLRTMTAGMKLMGINAQACKSLGQAKQLAYRFITNTDQPQDQLKLALIALGLPLHYEQTIMERWREHNFKPLIEFAPFAAHVVSVELFFQIALETKLISADRPSNRVDVAYLFYLPFCMIFVSTDKLHRNTTPHFLRSDQSFVWGEDLKRDLQQLVIRYKALPQEEQESGLLNFARTPPEDDDCLVSQLWNHHFKLLREQSYSMEADEEDEKLWRHQPSHKPFSQDHREVHRELMEFREAPTLAPEDVDFDISDPEVLSTERCMRKKRGSFYQLPKSFREGH